MAFTDAFADAIAYAEGFYVFGSRAARNNNPGNLTVDTIGRAVRYDGPFVVYGTVTDGWNALKRQIERMLDGTSAFYSPEMTIRQIADVYTATDKAAWAANVASRLGVTVNTVLGDLAGIFESYPVESAGILLIVALGLFWFVRKGI